jgi:hypothetical protein
VVSISRPSIAKLRFYVRPAGVKRFGSSALWEVFESAVRTADNARMDDMREMAETRERLSPSNDAAEPGVHHCPMIGGPILSALGASGFNRLIAGGNRSSQGEGGRPKARPRPARR